MTEKTEKTMITNLIYYFIKIKTLSPLSVGNGEAELTDHDLIRDSKGDPFIPASTLAGVFRSYLSKEDEPIFIPAGKQSPFFISDATIAPDDDKTTKEAEYKTSIRDGVRLDENKITKDGNKYDIEILEPGACFNFRIEVTVRENDNIEQMKALVKKLIANLNVGNILIGMKSTRGFGKVSVEYFGEKELKNEANNEFVFDFDKYNRDNYKECVIPDANIYDKYDTITIPLKQLGGISIRAYSAKAGDVDFEHIKSNGKPVIPGTSWNGLIRKQIEEYDKYLYKEMGIKNGYIESWFGTDNGLLLASKIIIEESIIENSKEIELKRNKIDRFSGGSADTALFNERSNFNGTTILTIKVPKTIEVKQTKNVKETINNNYLKGLIALTIKDIDNGLIALGGQTSIGRGIFKVNGKIEINNKEINIDTVISDMFTGLEVENG